MLPSARTAVIAPPKPKLARRPGIASYLLQAQQVLALPKSVSKTPRNCMLPSASTAVIAPQWSGTDAIDFHILQTKVSKTFQNCKLPTTSSAGPCPAKIKVSKRPGITSCPLQAQQVLALPKPKLARRPGIVSYPLQAHQVLTLPKPKLELQVTQHICIDHWSEKFWFPPYPHPPPATHTHC